MPNNERDWKLSPNGAHIDADRNLTEDEIKEWKMRLSTMSQEDLAELQRFAPSGHPVFDVKYSLHEHFKQCFKGFNPELSKSLGWDKDARFARRA